MKHALLSFAITAAAVASPVRASCPGDVDGSGVIDVTDLLAVLSEWGPCGGCPEDVDGSGAVDVGDLLIVLGSWGPCADPVELELAGRALDAGPHFDFVRAFNEGAVVEMAIDPANLPDAAVACDVYIVAAKSASEWESDPSLTDVRGTPQGVIFNGATIQANTISLTGSNTLSGDGGMTFGVDYDLVCDGNQNGALDGGDLIDGLTSGGFTIVDDTTSLGPLAATSITYSGGSFLGQKTWYPTGIAGMGPRPLVVISHGNGHNYTWYDYLQQHLASYGYVVMSHQNNTQPGIETASTTTLANTDYFLGNLPTIGGGIFDGRIDASRITWIGHSRGGEGVARAYDRLFDDNFVPVHYTIDDIRLISSIAPNDYLGRFLSDPHDVAYHLLIGAADGDNGGWPNLENDAPFHVLERAQGYRHATNVHGADHNDFNCCGFNDFQGPSGTQIGRTEAQRVAKSTYRALIAHYVDDSRAARDFLWRQYEVLRPIGVDPDTIVDHEYVEAPNPGLFVIDDFQTQTSLATSSSGGSVSGTVLSRVEARHDDTDGTFTWSSGDPMNGMSRGRTNDLSRGSVFDWAPGTDRFLEFEIIPGQRDLTDATYLTFRACQGTRHPQTVAEIGDTSFSVTLRDGSGTTSTIDFAAYGAGLQEPYQRTGSGSGAGWQNEYETIRMRLTDFLHNGGAIDLGDVVAVRFDFGTGFGSDRGRVAIDDLAVTRDDMPAPAALMAMTDDPDVPRERPRWTGTGTTLDDLSPVDAGVVVSVHAFTLAEPYPHAWRYEQPLVKAGLVVVLDVDPAMMPRRETLERVLFAGVETAERVSYDPDTRRLVAIVPGDADTARLWFGAPALPEQVDAAWLARERGRALDAGIVPARMSGGAPIRLVDRDALMRYADDLRTPTD